ncbi:MAG: SDR family oxidoreductase [Proteobacteria bacterium]|nr:SDR family oxidoreductase [Pseudomonadota bacterium]
MDQRRVLITGAGSGLGRALAFCFAEHGWRVACADIRFDRAQDTVRMMRDFGVGAMALKVDVGDDAAVEAMHDEILAAWDGVDCVVNNAGVACAGSVSETRLEDWRWTLNIDLMGVVRGCRVFLPVLLEQGSGHIVNIASFAGIANAPRMAAYSAAKAGVISLSETLRAELAGSAVKVSVVCPAFFATNLLESARAPEADKATASRLMAAATQSADEIAAHVYREVQRGRFLILPTRGERGRWRVKRFAPEMFFRKLVAMVDKAGGKR